VRLFAGSYSRILKLSSVSLGVALIAGLLWLSLPVSVIRYADTRRGEELSFRLEEYQRKHKSLPLDSDWHTLRQIGFTNAEIERAYPEYVKLDSTTYQLVFVKGFDGPYLMWNSSGRKWKNSFLTP
jgi:hypothetical protein